MLRHLSFLFRRSRRELASTILDMLGEGYCASDIKSLLMASREHQWKGSDLRAMRKSLREAQPKLKELARLKDTLGPSEPACQVLAQSYGHAESVAKQQCIDADGNPLPWYTYPAIDYLRQIDFSEKRVFEYGSGASTQFWSRRARQVVSIEQDAIWHGRVAASAPSNVQLHLAADKEDYILRITRESAKFDVIIISGEHRPECVAPALEMLSQTGFLILDNADWFPGTASELRRGGLLQVDMQGLGPINPYSWTTSLFFRPHAKMTPARARQPFSSPGSMLKLVDITTDPTIDKPALDGLDDKLAPYLNFEGGLFIEAGANNGFSQSNTFSLENSLGWKGMLVEAVPMLAEEAAKNRARSTVYQCALVADQNTTPSVTIHYCNLMSTVEDQHPAKQDIAKHLKVGVEVQNLPESYRIKVPGRTLSSLIDEYNPSRQIDFFSLDVEGYELEVLKGLDFSRHVPRRILVETALLEQVSAMLAPQGYVLEARLSGHDYLFFHDSLKA